MGKVGEDGLLEKFSIIQKDRLIQVCGVELPLGPIVARFPTMRIDKPIQELRKELDTCGEETFKIRLLPINEDPVIVTPSAWPEVFPQ